MSSPCYGCEGITMQRIGWTSISPVRPFCNAWETPLKKTPDGDPIPCGDCIKHAEDQKNVGNQ